MEATGMASGSSSKRSTPPDGLGRDAAAASVRSKLAQLKLEIQSRRLAYIKEKVEANGRVVQRHACALFNVAAAAEVASRDSMDGNELSQRAEQEQYSLVARNDGPGEREVLVYALEENLEAGTLVLSSSGCPTQRTVVQLVKLPLEETIPPYTAWIFLEKNQRMAEDESIVHRTRTYYKEDGNEGMVFTDTDDEITEPEEDKHLFTEGEDHLIWKATQEHGLSQDVVNILCQSVDASPSEIEERSKILFEKSDKSSGCSYKIESQLPLDKTIDVALESFDNLFCRRCLVFDCRLHGCSQNFIFPIEKQPYGFEPYENKRPCGGQCYLQRGEGFQDMDDDGHNGCPIYATGSRGLPRTLDLSGSKDLNREEDNIKSATFGGLSRSKLVSSVNTERDNTVSGDDSETENVRSDLPLSSLGKHYRPSPNESHKETSNNDGGTGNVGRNNNKVSSPKNLLTLSPWSTLERDLYLKGIQIFGNNSCLIARNLLSGLKTCMEVANYMYSTGANIAKKSLSTKTTLDDFGETEQDYVDMASRTRISRRRGRNRKMKYNSKSAGHPTVWKNLGDGKKWRKQYTPCGCQQMCGKDCPCVENGTCCEKYCGCSKSCKNKFRGCQCAKSQCRSRQCPCFAASRECDPDVCRNCWVSCGDGSLGRPLARGDGIKCGNMKLLLKQHQRILLGRSDVAGWGAFIKKPVNKNDYLGEYTGELISHKEAERRGKIYDLENSSFLFDLTDQYVLDAYRSGDKLKFANHSYSPNCYAKVMLVAGDHRVGIYAKKNIEAGEELSYHYFYGPDQTPPWVQKLLGSKKEDVSVSHRRAHKVARQLKGGSS